MSVQTENIMKKQKRIMINEIIVLREKSSEMVKSNFIHYHYTFFIYFYIENKQGIEINRITN